jgi:hypothetical protein
VQFCRTCNIIKLRTCLRAAQQNKRRRNSFLQHCAEGYPRECDSKNFVHLITYPHSALKHSENSPRRHLLEDFVNFFCRALQFFTTRSTLTILSSDSKTCFRDPRGPCEPPERRAGCRCIEVESNRCGRCRIVYLLNRSRRPRSQDQRGFRNGADVQIGGGVHVGDALQAIVGSRPVAIWVTVVLCRNFSRRAIGLRRFEQEEYGTWQDVRQA